MFHSLGKYVDFHSFLESDCKVIEGQANVIDKEVLRCTSQADCTTDHSSKKCFPNDYSISKLKNNLECATADSGFRVVQGNGECFTLDGQVSNLSKTCYIQSDKTCKEASTNCIKYDKGIVVKNCGANQKVVVKSDGTTSCSTCPTASPIAVKKIIRPAANLNVLSNSDVTNLFSEKNHVDFSDSNGANFNKMINPFNCGVSGLKCSSSPARLYKDKSDPPNYYFRSEKLVGNFDTCMSCPTGYHSSPSTNPTKCEENICSCSNGTPARRSACSTHNSNICASCNTGYNLQNKQCQANQCTCTNGKGATATACPINGSNKCATCNSGYTLQNNLCQANQCSCSNGTGATAGACQTNGSSICVSCNAGYKLDNNTCTSCPAGQWLPANNALPSCSPARCANGTNQDKDDSNRVKNGCKSCNEGYKLVNKKCTSCDAGKWLPANNALPSCSPAPCANGTNQDKDDSNRVKNGCKSCNAGYKLGTNKKCTACLRGEWSSPGNTSSSCSPAPCANGTSKTVTDGATEGRQCTDCKQGYELSGTHQCTACPAGEYKLGTNKNQCSPCPKGKYQPSPGKTSCNQCSPGYFQSNQGSVQCSPCPINTYSTTSGRTSSCLTCPQGKHQPSTGKTSCIDKVCSCQNGSPARATACPTPNTPKCASCNSGYRLLAGGVCNKLPTCTPPEVPVMVGSTPSCQVICKYNDKNNTALNKTISGGKTVITNNAIGYEIVVPTNSPLGKTNKKLPYVYYNNGSEIRANQAEGFLLRDLKNTNNVIKIKNGWWRKNQKEFMIACPTPNMRVEITKGEPSQCIDYSSSEARGTTLQDGCSIHKSPPECSRYVVLHSNQQIPSTSPSQTDYSTSVKARFKICSTPKPGFYLGDQKNMLTWYDSTGKGIEHNKFQWNANTNKWEGSVQ